MARFRRARRPWQPSERATQKLLNALSELYHLLRTPRPIDDLLQAILDTALRCVPGAHRGSLMVVADGQLRYRATVGYDLEQLRAISIPADLAYTTILHGQRSIQVAGYAEWDEANLDAPTLAILREHGHIDAIRSSLVTSILVSGRFYGTLVLDNLQSHAPFPAAARTLAQLFADQAGTLIEQAELLEQVRQANSQLIESERLATLGRFIASIAHEINNPLTAVLGYADFLALKDLDAEGQELLGQLRAGADRVRAIVRNLQLFARQQKNEVGMVDLNLLIDQILTLKRGELGLDQITAHNERNEALPLLWADGGALSQVLLNLIGNAQYVLRERALPRRISIRTAVATEGAEQTIRLYVSDNGPGVTAAIRERIFEPFFSTKPSEAGTGLGLSICRKIATDHGGRLWLGPERDGATFVLELPLRAAPTALTPTQLQPAPSSTTSTAAPQGLLILVVDDDPAVVAMVRTALSGSNRLHVAGNGVEALTLCALEPFDLILCDLKMPVMSGPEFYERLRQDHPTLTKNVMFISGDTTSPTTRAFLEACGRPLLSKPFTAAELRAAIMGGMR